MSPAARRFTWSIVVVLALCVLYAVLQVGFVRPYLSPTEPVSIVARPPADAAGRLEGWRAEYRSRATLAREPIWRTGQRGAWARRHLGMTVQVLVFTIAAIVLLVLRSDDVTAGLAVLALALSAVAGGGPLFGVEQAAPPGVGALLIVFAWIATPLAFPIIALAILYFPERSPLLSKHPVLHVVPFAVALPMLAAGGGAGLYLAGIDAAGPLAVWDARNPAIYFSSFAAALAINLAVIVDGVYRYRFNRDANERRRIRMAVYTGVPGVAAFAVRDGLPIVAQLAGTTAPAFPVGVTILLQALVILPAFGVVYAVGVERVLGPRTVLRRSLQYALASRTLTVVAVPASQPMVECPRCGRCEEAGTPTCPSEGAAMQPVPSVPRTVDGKYRIDQLLGRGGMGAVYRARDLRLDRLVALKVVRAELLGDPEARRRFLREAQIVARLQHPAIVSVYDFGILADGGAYLVMELVRGEDLRRVLQREGRLDPRRALSILTTVCGAIEAAHREGVLHRDLKPENILLPGGGGEAKVLDFEVAKVLDDRQVPPAEAATIVTAAGMIVGTPAYMAPEQLRGGAVDGRTDVFSLGVIAFEMLTGQLPFGRGSLADVVLAHARGVPPIPGTDPALARAVRAALEPEPDRRPASPQALAHLLSAASGI